eukprot:c5270_g1_i1 orf=177-1694(-)
MGSSAELTLGRPCHGASHGAFSGDHVERMLKLEYYLKSLEDERKKIEAFKRELPLCMQLLSDEIEASKEQLADYQEPPANLQSILSSTCEDHPSAAKSSSMLPVLEEFMPIKKPAEDVQEENVNTVSKHSKGTKPSGVLQTKFWSLEEAYAHGQEMVSSMTDKPYKKRDSMRTGVDDIEVAKPILSSQKRGGAFLPFSGSKKPTLGEQLDVSPRFQDGEASPCTDIARSSSISEGVHHHQPIKEMQNVSVAAAATSYNTPGQTQRKPRRCWSPELHRRFVNALQQLGGSEVATPKQIRELMKVDGLTNDEVKSHLQKYRLHTRRPNPSFHASTAHTPQVVVLGGIWVPQEYAAQAAASVNQAAPHQQQEIAERQATHVQATPSYTDERCIQLSSANMHHHALYCDRDGHAVVAAAAAMSTQSQGSSQGPVHHASAHSSDAGREDESLGEEGNEGCSWKDGHDENVDNYGGAAAVHVHKWMYKNDAHESGEDDSEAEDGRVYETPI